MLHRSRTSVGLIASIGLLGCAGHRPHEPVAVDAVGAELRSAFDARTPDLVDAIDRTIAWLESEPGLADDHRAEVAATLATLGELLAASDSAEQFAGVFERDLRLRRLPGDGDVLFTGYFSPEFAASRTPDHRHRFALHGPPEEIVCGNPERVRWHTRSQIVAGDLLAGREIAWLADPLDCYLVHVNGSARLRLPGGSRMAVTHCGTNEQPYASLGRMLVERDAIASDEVSMQSIRALHGRDPALVESLMLANDRYVFFREDDDPRWPRSSRGIPLTPMVSVAVDGELVAAGTPVLVVTRCVDGDGRPHDVVRFMLAHDTGGAIIGPGRVDIFMGVGADAGEIAGRQRFEGRLYLIDRVTDRGAGTVPTRSVPPA